MNRAGFTLIELLIVAAIIGTMLAGAVLGVAAGRQSAHMRTATQRAQHLARHARTMALLKKCPAVITFEEVYDGDGAFAGGKVTIESQPEGLPAAMLGAAQTLSYGAEGVGIGGLVMQGEDTADSTETADDPMSRVVDDPIETEDERKGKTARQAHSFAGIHLKAEILDEDGRDYGENRNRISVFSNVDYLRRQAQKPRSETVSSSGDGNLDGDEEEDAKPATAQEPVSIAYEPNGNCQPYRITVWKDGSSEHDGLVINVDKFGKVKVEDEK